MNPSLSWSLLCALLLPGVVTCVPLNDSLFFTTGRNHTVSRPISISTKPHFHCTTSAAWTGADELSLSFFQDCWRAINTFFNQDVWPHGVSEYEFLGDGSVPVHHNTKQRTPRRYFFGTCTVAIINRPDIPQEYWPGRSLSVEPETDVASYDEIYHALRAVGDECLTLHSEVGWVLAGEESGVVGMVFKTTSPVDEAIAPTNMSVPFLEETVDSS